MKNWQKILIPFVITLTIGGMYLFIVFRQRSAPGVTRNQPEQKLTADQLAIVRVEFPQHFEDVKDLEGKSVWMKNGYSMPYYPYTGGHVEWAKPAGLIPPGQRLEIKKAIKAAVPAKVDDSISHGTQQALVVFTLPGGTAQFATPVGALEGSASEQYFDDLLFYYDDPHTIYTNWPKDVWEAIDAHQVKPGFSELQTRMAIGSKAQYDGGKEGERTAIYTVNGKQITVTFEHDKATKIQEQPVAGSQ